MYVVPCQNHFPHSYHYNYTNLVYFLTSTDIIKMEQRTNRSLVLGFQVFLGLLSVSLTLARSDLRQEFPGPYCQKIDRCCHNREDDCATPIAGKFS